jgi:CIC family chloride channel protein
MSASSEPPRPRRLPTTPRLRVFAALFDDAPLDLRILGRTLVHAVGVGCAAGVVGVGFLIGLELLQRVFLEQLAGYVPLRASGEGMAHETLATTFRPWILAVVPAFGALVSGILTLFAPEARGGGGDAMIEAFHHQGGVIRPRVIWIKWLASMFTLGLGGSGGREGSTMHFGAAIGSGVGGFLRVGPRERRVLMVAGVAAGMSAVFRTPLGAALIAIEVLYRDDFESEALIPALLASVMAYAISASVFGEGTLFAHADHYPFHAAHLPLYVLLALLIAPLAIAFVGGLHGVQALSRKLPLPQWATPALGGLALGLFAVPIIVLVGNRIGAPGHGLGILGGGYGAAQMAIVGSDLLPGGWLGVQLLLLLCAAKLVASSLTIGSGGSAGDFAPSLVLGGLLGGAFGRAAQLVLHDPSIDPGAFALVGMGAFYGGIAHAPVSALIFVSEFAGSYELLVPMMLAGGVAFVALRKHSLYGAQLPSRMQSPAHAPQAPPAERTHVRDVLERERAWITLRAESSMEDALRSTAPADGQFVIPVLDAHERLSGVLPLDTLRRMAIEKRSSPPSSVDEVALPAVSVDVDATLRSAAETLRAHRLYQVPVIDSSGRYVGMLDSRQLLGVVLERDPPATS